MNDEKFKIRFYGKSELAMMYFPHHDKRAALKLLRTYLKASPDLQSLLHVPGCYYTPKQVRKIVKIIGEPFDLE